MNTNFCMFVFIRTSEEDAVITQQLFTLSCKEYLRSANTKSFREWVSYTTSEEISALVEQVMQELSADVVKHTQQTLTDAQKAQARQNIGAVSADEVVSEQVQADWEQNDESMPNYVKNRPFYTGEAVVIIEEQTFTIEPLGEWSAYFGTSELVEGKTYLVRFDGTDYACEAYGLYNSELDGEFEGVALGNIDIAAESNMGRVYENKGNGEPFAVEVDMSGTLYAFAKPGEHTIKLTAPGSAVIEPAYQDAIRASFPAVELTATLSDGTKQILRLYGEVVKG